MHSKPQSPFRIFCSTSALTLILHGAHADTVNKCESNGRITYTDQPCANGSTILPYTDHTSPPNDPVAAQQRYLADKKQLEQIDREKAQQDRQWQHDTRLYAQQQKKAREHQLSCKNLDIKRQMRQQAQIDARNKHDQKQIKKTQQQLAQAENTYEKFCVTE